MPKQKFPKGFLWGASTAAHQVEGHNHNQWSEWELANAERLAASAEKRFHSLPSWKQIKTEAQKPENYISGNGVEHYTRYKEDFKLLKKLHLNAFRFGIEWSRIEPKPGEWDQPAIDHYRDYIAQLRGMDIEPIPTLWHWTMPVWFTDLGGLEKRRNRRYVERYMRKIAEEFGADFHYVLPLNEPNVYMAESYIDSQSEWPPARRSPWLAFRVYRNLAAVHRAAYKILKAANPHVQVGVALHLADIRPLHTESLADRLSARLQAYVWNWWFLNRTRRALDFIGVNFYHTEYRDWRTAIHNPSQPLNDLGWYMEPSGLSGLLQQLWRRYHMPIIITENGLADARDKQRQWWLAETMAAMQTALAQGVDLRGYLHWSLLDNFEWAYGWWPKFGLVAVDRKTMKRRPRPSARWFADQIAKNSSQSPLRSRTQ